MGYPPKCYHRNTIIGGQMGIATIHGQHYIKIGDQFQVPLPVSACPPYSEHCYYCPTGNVVQLAVLTSRGVPPPKSNILYLSVLANGFRIDFFHQELSGGTFCPRGLQTEQYQSTFFISWPFTCAFSTLFR